MLHFATFSCFAEVTFHCLKVRAHHKLLLHAALYTSIYPFIFSPVPPHPGWKMGKSASAAEEAKRVLPQSVTNASLDAWRGHSSLLSAGDNVLLRYLLLTHLNMHAFLHINAADTLMCCKPQRMHKCTQTHIYSFILLLAIQHFWYYLLHKSCFPISVPISEFQCPLQSLIRINIQPANTDGLIGSEAYGYSH